MDGGRTTRRAFLGRGAGIGAGLGLFASGLGAAGGSRILGANDRIRVGIVGCGGRSAGLLRWLWNAAEPANATAIAVCDIWRDRRESMAKAVRDLFGVGPRIYPYHAQVLDDPDVDAVIIATPDHQHCGQLIDAVKAGRDVYIEKPIAMTMEELNAAYDAVKETGAIVQNGTQGRSDPGKEAARAFIASGRMGKLFRVESWETAYAPYWNGYVGPEKESDTDWKAFLHNVPDQPFDRDKHGAWMGYREFSMGPIGGWMSHFSDFVHGTTGCGFPVSAVAQGAIVAPTSDRRRTCPDTVTALLEYAEGFVTMFTTHFGSSVSNETTTFFFEKGVMRTRFGHAPGAPVVSGDGSDHPERIREPFTLPCPPTTPHMQNWLECIRSREAPSADMEAGYMQGVAVILADLAYVAGRKMLFDRAKRAIRPA